MYWDFYTDSKPVARKPHRCDECRTTINPGERYYRYRGKWDGEMQHGKTCLPCKDAADWFTDHGYCDEGWIVGELDEALAEEARASKSFAAYRHVVGIRRRRREARQLHS